MATRRRHGGPFIGECANEHLPTKGFCLQIRNRPATEAHSPFRKMNPKCSGLLYAARDGFSFRRIQRYIPIDTSTENAAVR